MSRVKDRTRAKAGHPHHNTHEPMKTRVYVCAHCHRLGQFVKVGDYYFHASCPKRVI